MTTSGDRWVQRRGACSQRLTAKQGRKKLHGVKGNQAIIAKNVLWLGSMLFIFFFWLAAVRLGRPE